MLLAARADGTLLPYGNKTFFIGGKYKNNYFNKQTGAH
jgi:hypothetical protein